MRTYSYDPSKINVIGLDRMRFELGDTVFSPAELTAALCNEEYLGLIETYTSWRQAKIACLKAILMKFSHQVNFSADGLSYSFSDRIKVWQELLIKEEKKLGANGFNKLTNILIKEKNKKPYFYENMQTNPNKGEENV